MPSYAQSMESIPEETRRIAIASFRKGKGSFAANWSTAASVDQIR